MPRRLPLSPKRCWTAGDRPVEIAAKWTQGQCGRIARSARDVAQPRLQILLRAHEFAGELGIEVALLIDIPDEGVAILKGPLGCGLRFVRVEPERLETIRALAQGAPRASQHFEPALMRGKPVSVAARQRGQHSRGLPDAPRVRKRQHQPEVPSASQFVQLDDARAKLRPGRLFLLFELPDLRIDHVDLLGGVLRFRVHFPEFFRLDLPLDLETSQLAQERAFLGRELVRFALQRLQAVGGAGGKGFGLRAIGSLRAKQHGPQQE